MNLTAPNIMLLARVRCDPEPALTSAWSSAVELKQQSTGTTNNHVSEAELRLCNIQKFSSYLTTLSALREQSLHS
jgi:hypothetical protein